MGAKGCCHAPGEGEPRGASLALEKWLRVFQSPDRFGEDLGGREGSAILPIASLQAADGADFHIAIAEQLAAQPYPGEILCGKLKGALAMH